MQQGIPPSERAGITCAYCAYCFDEALEVREIGRSAALEDTADGRLSDDAFLRGLAEVETRG